jgi:hypothetical protein
LIDMVISFMFHDHQSRLDIDDHNKVFVCEDDWRLVISSIPIY